MFRVFADITMVTHFAYLTFVVLGGFLAWRWRRAIVAHLVAVGWAVVILAVGPGCPLTYIEDRLRRRAGQPGLAHGFVDGYIEGVLYPAQYAGYVRMLAGAVIVVSWLGGYLLARGARRETGPNLLSHVDH
jgi:Protein of Unknown function (DUF2784)